MPTTTASHTPTTKKLGELYELIADIKIAMLTTCREDGLLVTRPMATQQHNAVADLWFVTNIETYKIDELRHNPNVNLAYYNSKTYEWVSVSGRATISQDRSKIHELHQPDWRVWFEDEGGNRDGGPDDPRLALILVQALEVHYLKAKHSRPLALFEYVKGMITGTAPDLGREEHLKRGELH